MLGNRLTAIDRVADLQFSAILITLKLQAAEKCAVVRLSSAVPGTGQNPVSRQAGAVDVGNEAVEYSGGEGLRQYYKSNGLLIIKPF